MSIFLPKVFISYSRTNIERVIELAKRLVSNGVDVVLDVWNLKEGQDKYVFMEQAVVDPSINKVLLICDRVYTEKANARKDGVGDETMIISAEVYDKVEQEKFIPIIFERDENGKEYTPVYLKTRIYIDLSVGNAKYEDAYEQLIRNLHNKPEHRKPALGKMPEWLNDESVDFSGVRNLLKQVQNYDGKNKNKFNYAVRKFSDEFTITLRSLAPAPDADLDKTLLAQIDVSKPLRDLFFDYVEAVIVTDSDVADVLGDFFEKVYNGTYTLDDSFSSSECHRSYSESEFEFSRFMIWEMFIGSTAILLHYEKYRELNNMLNRTFFLTRNAFGHDVDANTFVQFQPALEYIEGHIKPKSENPNRLTLAGDIVVKREKQSIITRQSLIDADIVLFQLSLCGFGNQNGWHWFPRLYVLRESVRCGGQTVWSKMVSFKHCQKLYSLFGVTGLEQLKEMIKKSKPNEKVGYSRAWDSAPLIQQSIELDKIGSLP